MKNTVIANLLFCVMFFSSMSASAQDYGWEQKKELNGIRVYIRNVEGSNFKEFKGITTLYGASLSSLLALFDDTASYTRWMHNCLEARLIKIVDKRRRYVYTVTKGQGPVSDRDSAVYSNISQNMADKTITIDIVGVPNYIPEDKTNGRIRILAMKARWTFKPDKPGQIIVTYQLHSDPGGYVPGSLANSAVVDLPYFTLLNMKRVVQEDKYKKARISEISEPSWVK